jgi:hypothetical protein
LRSNKDEFSLEINEHFTVLGRTQIIKISQIRGFKSGSNYGHEVKLLTSPLVTKDGDEYVLLNYFDPRIASILDKYDSNTKVEVVIIPSEHAAAVKFIAGDLNPQVTPNTKFSDFFIDLSQSHSKQALVRDFFTREKSHSKSKIDFNVSAFISKLGTNVPTASTASKLASSVASIEITPSRSEKTETVQEKNEPHIVTPNGSSTEPTIDSSNPPQTSEPLLEQPNNTEEEPFKAALDSLNNIDELPTYNPITHSSTDTHPEQSLTEEKASSYDEYHKSDEFLDSTQESPVSDKETAHSTSPSTEANHVLTEEEMIIKWEKHSNSQYPLAFLRKILGPNQNLAVTKKLNSLQPATPEFDEFLRILLDLVEKRLQKMKVNEPKN